MKDLVRISRAAVLAGCLVMLAPQAAQAAAPQQLLRQMTGTWNVKEWMWPAPAAQPIVLPAAIAHRRLIRGKFLAETMRALAGPKNPFTRISYFDYNPVSGQYEYFSIDTRAPQMMIERSRGPAKQRGPIDLYGRHIRGNPVGLGR